MAEYLVSLDFSIAANSPEEAAKTMIQWITEDGPNIWVYAVQNVDTGEIVKYDADTRERV